MYDNVTFSGKSEKFLEIYKAKIGNIPLRETILKSISNEENLLGEGLSKQGFRLEGIKDYIIRIYKGCFKREDLNLGFVKPEKSQLNNLDGVVLCIPGKIDIVKKKRGVGLGVNKYAEKLQISSHTTLNNIFVSREETLRVLEIYEKLKDFPIKSYERAYLQMKSFCEKPNYQFDIINPNNILIDTKTKQINLIDPVSPRVNQLVHGDSVDFSKFHGCDSLYPVMCDFIMQREHLSNLSPEEQDRWKDAICKIISNCIYAGEKVGCERNIKQLEILYRRITNFWGTDALCERYSNFVNMYSHPINTGQTINIAIDYKNDVPKRIIAIKALKSIDFGKVKHVFEKILEASHQPKVEFPEIINAVLDTIKEYGLEAKEILPKLEKLFDKEIFPPTKKKLYSLFIELQPNNEKFLCEMEKSSSNSIEKRLFAEEINKLLNKKGVRLGRIIDNFLRGSSLPKELIDKIWLSRTCTNLSDEQEIAIDNIIKAYSYIESIKSQIPNITDLIQIHKIAFENIPKQDFVAGRLRTPDTDELVRQIFNIKRDTNNLVNDYSSSAEVIKELEKLQKYIDDNYFQIDCFKMAANIFNKVIQIHPFLNGNGRAGRLFVEQFLLSKGYRLVKWPEEVLYRKIYTTEQIEELIRQNSVKE